MAKATFVQQGASIDYTPSVAVSAGDIVDLGDLVGIAKVDIAANVLGALAIDGVFDVVKSGSTGPVFAKGDPVFFDYVNNVAVKTGFDGCLLLGPAAEAAGTSDTLVRVELRPHGLPSALQGKLWEDVSLAGGAKVLDIQDVGKVMNVTTGHASNGVTLPATAAGLAFTVRNGTAGQRIAIDPAAADKIMGPDIAGVDNKDRILAAATSHKGDYVELEYGGADGYLIRAQRGVWSNEA